MAETMPIPCERCGAPTVRIALLPGGSLTMHSCSRCDHRAWRRDGVPARFDEVLASVGAASGRNHTD